MIELSKCPNCKSEDRVTIAGKEFCMSCGTPSDAVDSSNSNNAGQGAAQSAGQNTEAIATPSPDQSMQGNVSDLNQDTNEPAANSASSVSKFSNSDSPSLSLNDSAGATATPNDPPSLAIANSPQVESQPTEVPKLILPNPSLSGQTPSNNIAGIIPQAAQIASNVYPLEGQSTIGTTRTIPSPLHGDIGLDTKNPSVMTDDQLHALQNSVNSAQVMPSSAADNSTASSQAGNIALSSSFSPSEPTPLESTASPDNNNGKPTAQFDHFKSATESGPKKSKIKNPLSGDLKSKAKPAAVAASIVAMFLIGAYIWSTNYPNLAFKIASAKSGITASMPGYVPAGFNLTGDIMTNPGAVSYNLIDQTKSKKISISQSKTDWDSQALAENYVAPKADNYTALNAQGITIYVLGNSQASWINKGTWSKIESSDGVLNQDQIIKIATSL